MTPSSPGHHSASDPSHKRASWATKAAVVLLALGGLICFGLSRAGKSSEHEGAEAHSRASGPDRRAGGSREEGRRAASSAVRTESVPAFSPEDWADRAVEALGKRDALAELKVIDVELKAMDPDRFRLTARAMERDPSLGPVARFQRLDFMVRHWMDAPLAQGSAGLQAQLDMIAEFLPMTLPHGGSPTLMLSVLPNGMQQDPSLMTDFMIQHWGLWDGETGDGSGNVFKGMLLKYDLDPERRSKVEGLADVR